MQFFGKTVSDTGCEILIKMKTRFPDPVHPGHESSWRDGQIISIMPLGFHTATFVGYCLLLIKLPNVNYLDIGGRTQAGWKILPATPTIWDKINHTANINGKYKWEVPKGNPFNRVRKTRDYFIDLKKLENTGDITESEREQAYDHNTKTILTVASVMSINSILRHENTHTRLDPSWLLEHASITSGTHSIGSGLDYDTVTAFEAAIGATLTATLRGEHANEETAITTDVTFDFDTATYDFVLTAASGAEHNGGAYGNGARITFGAFDSFTFVEASGDTLNSVEVSKLALDITGSGNQGIIFNNGGDSGLWKINRMLIAGDADSANGLYLVEQSKNELITNNTCYGIGNGAADAGIRLNVGFGSATRTLYNNTCIGNYDNFYIDTSGNDTLVFKNNLAQGSGNSDYRDGGFGYGTTAKNISEDATSPDASYRSKDLHTNTVFNGYATDDYTIDKDGDSTNLAILDDGEDLSGTFTDDVNNATGRRSAPFDIGASQRDPAAAGGGPVAGSLSLMGVGI